MSKTIGIDIGGTKIAIGIIDAEGKIIDEKKIPTHPQKKFSYSFFRICQVIDALIEKYCSSFDEFSGIGVGCAGPLDLLNGRVSNPYTLPGWDDAPIKAMLEDRYKCTVVLENDADAALLGELKVRSTKWESVIMLTFGTGVGGAVYHNGEIFRAESNGHPELGHVVVSEQMSNCYCGTNGCLESVASGSALTRKAKDAGYKDFPDFINSNEDSLGEELINYKKEILDNWVRNVTHALWNFMHTFYPQLIILGGGAMESLFDLVYEEIQEKLRKSTFCSNVILEKALMEGKAGMIGAASLVDNQGYLREIAPENI